MADELTAQLRDNGTGTPLPVFDAGGCAAVAVTSAGGFLTLPTGYKLWIVKAIGCDMFVTPGGVAVTGPDWDGAAGNGQPLLDGEGVEVLAVAGRARVGVKALAGGDVGTLFAWGVR